MHHAINQELESLSCGYTQDAQAQHVSIHRLPELHFPHRSGGSIAGGSSTFIQRHFSDGGIYEPGTIATLLALKSAGHSIDCVLDIGALYGYFSLVAAATFPTAELHCFEMNPDSCASMAHNMEANSELIEQRMHIHNCVLSNDSARGRRARISRMSLAASSHTVSTTEAVARFVMSGLRKIYHRQLDYRLDFDQTMDFWTLDDFCKVHHLQPDLIKIDVEGYQSKILPGAMDAISQHMPIVILEFDAPEVLRAHGRTNKDIVEPLFELGYQAAWGYHRDASMRFSRLELGDMSPAHERNSLAVFYPADGTHKRSATAL